MLHIYCRLREIRHKRSSHNAVRTFEFLGNRRMQGRTFHMAVNKITLTHVP